MAREIIETENENLPAEMDTGHNAYEAYGAQAVNRTIVGQILKFAKGFWKAGQDNVDVDPDIKLIVDMRTLTIGWQKWENERPVDNFMGLVSERYQPPRRDTLGDKQEDVEWEKDSNGKPRDPWQRSNMVLLREVGTAGDDEGRYTFITSSIGGMNAVGLMAQRYGRKIREDDQALPVIELDTSSYKHHDRRIGDVYTPVLRIVGWATVEDIDDATNTAKTMVPEDVKTLPPKKAEPPRKAAPSKASTKVDPKAKKKTKF